jgi:hypothetical protein
VAPTYQYTRTWCHNPGPQYERNIHQYLQLEVGNTDSNSNSSICLSCPLLDPSLRLLNASNIHLWGHVEK